HIYTKLHFIDALAKARKQSLDSAVQMVSSPEGIALMDTIQNIVSNIYKMERSERTQYAKENEMYIGKTNFTIILSELIAFLIILFVLLRLNSGMAKRMESEKLVRESEIRYRTIAQNVGSFIYTCDYYGKITFATPNISKLTGYSPEEIIGKHFTFLVAADYVEAIKNGYYTQFKNKIKEQTSEFELVTRTGLRKKVKQDVVIFSTEDMMMGFQCTIHDLNEANTI
ncbi:MAG TPA: PAS domain S-box protein, partial [Bacteroidia bacterium]|nr:PAS domain S-box protein [Bacteroidia bacterium]